MKREKTKYLGFIDRAYPLALETINADDAGQLVTCAELINEYKTERDRYQNMIDVQKAEIIAILRRLHRNPLNRDIVLYSDTPENWTENVDMAPDGIFIATSAQYTQQRLDTMKMKRLAPETYKAYLKTIKCKGKILTGVDINNIIPNYDESYD